MSSNVTNNEQPMSKRQKIDAAENTKKGAFSAINGIENKHHISETNQPPDILPTTKPDTKGSTNVNTINDLSSSIITLTAANEATPIATATETTPTKTTTSTTSSPPKSPSDELDNAASVAAYNVIPSIEFPDLLKTSPEIATTSKTNDSDFAATTVATAAAPQPSCSHKTSATNSHETSSRLLSSKDNGSNFSRLHNIDEFQLYLMKQCLCDMDKQALRRSFAVANYYQDVNGLKYNAPLKDWPAHELIQFLSNMELLFEVYLNQNAKGEICTQIMDVCEALLQNVEFIDDIFQLDEYNNKFVQYLAIKVLANCLLYAKDKGTYCEDLLTTLMRNLVIDHQPNDHRALGKVSFILGIILHIMEWKDLKKHPLNEFVINGREVYNDSDTENFTLPINIPPIENNYFAVHHDGDDEAGNAFAPTPPADNHLNESDEEHSYHPHHHSHLHQHHHPHHHDHDERDTNNPNARSTCHLQYLSDSESFDSNYLKISILSRLSKQKWRYLVDNMAKCVTLLQSNRNLHYIENTVMTFLTLWERIISVDTCIEYDSTLPFHEFLAAFEEILIRGNLPTQIYKQILTLFSASLCYTTTLALQPEVPQETTRLAGEIFKSVRSQRIFLSLPTNTHEPENNISFIGCKHTTIVYETLDRLIKQNGDHKNHEDDDEDDPDDDDDDDDEDDDSDAELELNEQFNRSIDFTLLQKFVLLILKAIAVTVRPIGGGDSSDNSMDSCSSTSSTAETTEQECSFVEAATCDAVEKLQIFLRNKLNFHPETHLSKVIVHLFSNQDDYLLEAMLCMLGTTIAFLPRQPAFGSVATRHIRSATNERPQFRILVETISPVYTFLEFLEIIQYEMQSMLDFLITDETCFLLYFLRFLKYIRSDWTMFQSQCNKWHTTSTTMRTNNHPDKQPYKRVMDVLISLRFKLDRLVMLRLFPYDISPLIALMRDCETLYDESQVFGV